MVEVPRPGVESENGKSPEQSASEQEKAFEVRFPDGTMGRFKSRMEATEAIKDWKENR